MVTGRRAFPEGSALGTAGGAVPPSGIGSTLQGSRRGRAAHSRAAVQAECGAAQSSPVGGPSLSAASDRPQRPCHRQRAATRMCGCDRRIERRRSSSINFHACAIERYAQCGAASVDNGASAGAWPGACSTGAAMGSTRLLPPSLGCDGPRRERSADAVKHPSGQRCGVAWRGGEAWA